MKSEYQGLIVEYYTKEGSKQRAELRFADNNDRSVINSQQGKALLRLLNQDGTPKLQGTKQINMLVAYHKLIRIGFID